MAIEAIKDYGHFETNYYFNAATDKHRDYQLCWLNMLDLEMSWMILYLSVRDPYNSPFFQNQLQG